MLPFYNNPWKQKTFFTRCFQVDKKSWPGMGGSLLRLKTKKLYIRNPLNFQQNGSKIEN